MICVKVLGEIRGFVIFALLYKRPVRLRARTPPFHGGDTGSNPVRATSFKPLHIEAAFLFLVNGIWEKLDDNGGAARLTPVRRGIPYGLPNKCIVV